MASRPQRPSKRPPPGAFRRRNVGRLLARLVCVVFALIGAIPLLAGLAVQSEPLRQWAAAETARLLETELGLKASYSVELNLLPLRLAVTDLVVPAKDGGSPALTAGSVSVRPRFFSLLAGRIDVGDIELDEARVRLVVRKGEITNVDYRLPETKKSEGKLERAPFKSLSVSDVRIDADIDGTRIETGATDVDVFAEAGLAFDVALRMGEGRLTSEHALPPPEEAEEPAAKAQAGKTPPTAPEPPAAPLRSFDEDALCGLELRVHVTPEELLVRRLSLLAIADQDPATSTRPSCEKGREDDLGRVAVRLSQLRVVPTTALPRIEGHVLVRTPLSVVNRFTPSPTTHGWAGFSGDVQFGGGARLPTVHGRVSGAGIGMDEYVFAQKLDGEVHLEHDVVVAPELNVRFSDGDVTLQGVRIAPFEQGGTLALERLEAKGVLFPALMRDLGVTPNTIVTWDYDDVVVTKVRGTLSPFYLDGAVKAETSNFAVYDSAWHDPAKEAMVGVKRSHIETRWRAHATALEFYDSLVTFGKSRIVSKLVSIGFNNTFALDIPEGAVIDLDDIGPLAGLDIHGVAHLQASATGPLVDPVLTTKLSVDQFSLAGFETGDIVHADARFQPLRVDFTNVLVQKNTSDFTLDRARLSFDGPATVAFDAHVKSKRFGVRDFFEVWHMDEDPRYEGISGTGEAEADVHYALGGPEDQCKSGKLVVDGRVALGHAEIFGESYTGAEADFHLNWADMEASSYGFDVDVPSLALRKGSGALIGSLHISPGAVIDGNVLATAVPVSNIDGLGIIARQWDGVIDGVGRISGTLDALAVTANAEMSQVRIGRVSLPRSSLRVRLEPVARERKTLGKSRCGNPIPTEFDPAEYQKDRTDGVFHVSGQLFGGQVAFDDLTVTQQRSKLVKGEVALRSLDVGALLESWPTLASRMKRTHGKLTGKVVFEEYFLDRPLESEGELVLTGADLGAEGFSLGLATEQARVSLRRGDVKTEGLAWEVVTVGGQRGIVDVGARVMGGREIDASLVLRETELKAVASILPGVERTEGTFKARLDVRGPLRDPRYEGQLEVHEGRLFLKSFDSPIEDLELEVGLEPSGIVVRKGTARMGGGTLELSGNAPFSGREVGRVTALLRARGVTLPLGEGIQVSVDSDLEGSYVPRESEDQRSLPKLGGTVTILSASYRRPMAVTADLAALTGRGKKTEVDTYDPSKDGLELDVLVVSKGALTVENDLVDAELRIDPAGLRISGTDQRFGAVGSVQLKPGGQLRLRRNEFEIRQGIVRFTDPTRIAPQVDVTATTEYRRYDSPGTSETGTTTSTTTGSGTLGGLWRINLHAYGEPENLRVDLTSDPSLAQDDIFLLLTVGLTRAELDQTRSAGVGSSVALEALGTLSGAGEAVTEAVPVIDDFRFGSAYSSRTGRTEPTVTIGKRLSERIRASVTTSLAGSSEVRSNVEWRMSQRVSVEGSYDNVEDIGSPVVGNLGGDVRWRLEFE